VARVQIITGTRAAPFCRGLVAVAHLRYRRSQMAREAYLFHCGSRKVDTHLRDRVRPERGPRGLRSFIRLGNWPNLAQFVTRLIVGPVVSGRSRRGRSSWRPHRRYSQVFRPAGTPALAHPSGRRVMAAPLTTEHREILHQRSPVKAEASFDDLAAKAHPAVGRTVARLS